MENTQYTAFISYRHKELELFPEVDLEQTFNHPYMSAVALSPDSKYLAVAIGRTEIGMEAVELYELPSGRKATSLEYDLSDGSSAWWQTRGIKNLAFSPNGQFLSAIDGESTVHIFGSSSGNRITSIPGSEAVGSAESYEIKTVFSPDSQWLAVWAPNSNLTVYRTQTGEFTDEYGNGAMNFTCGYVFSPDGEQFYMGATDGLVCIETKTGKVVKRFPYRPNYGMSISPDGEKLAFGGHTEDMSLTNCFFLLDTKTGAQLWCSETTVGIRGVVAWSPDGAFVAASDTNDGRTTVWDSATGDIKWIFDGYDPIFSADSGFLLIGASPAVGRNLSDTKTGSVLYDMQSGAITVQLPEIGICSPSGNAVLMQDAIWRMKPL